ncbi:hypothetical protein EI94DRAFT_1706500 [Lactarius quietus]|nr:hypothetical protein EI94DRAFT_1706500 [Lactarius quietus]
MSYARTRGGSWYEAHDPMTGARGLVSRAMYWPCSSFNKGAAPSSTLPPVQDLVLFRTYNNFFDNQTSLLDSSPRRWPRGPFHLGPSDLVSANLSATQQTELDDYLRCFYG